MQTLKSISIVICYLGKLPWYFNYFLHSCAFNPTIDFFIFTDDETFFENLPKNVKISYTTLKKISELATKKLGFEIEIKFPYKLNDFKPTYKVLFDDLIKDYDFWGYGDLDVIYGNIRNFITTELMDNYDLISVRPDWIPGCFLLFKNSDKMNTLFMKSKDYKKVFISDTHYCFDETSFAHTQFEEGIHFSKIDTEIESMMHVIKKEEEQNIIKPYFDLYIIDGIPGKITWNNGTLVYRNKYEILLYHLMRFKKKCKIINKPKKAFGNFTITPTRIIHFKN